MSEQDKFTRRQILKTGAAIFGSFSLFGPVPEVLPTDKHLIMVHLAGGNDALNTVVPYTDARYYKLRSSLSIKPASLKKISPSYGLHPSLIHLSRLYQQGNVAIVLGTGYPEQSMSHVLSTSIWNSGDLAGNSSRYWFDSQAKASKTIKHVDRSEFLKDLRRSPGLLSGTRKNERAEPVTGKPVTNLFKKQKVKSKFAFSNNIKVHHLEIDGFDTHEDQLVEHASALSELDDTLASATGLLGDSNYLIYVYSEFGRTVRPNEEGGTDHGAGGVTFLVGADINGGIYGDYGKLANHPSNALASPVDFRTLQSNILTNFISC